MVQWLPDHHLLISSVCLFSSLEFAHAHTHKLMHNYTYLRNTQTYNNEWVDILSDYLVQWLPENTNQLSAPSTLCMCWWTFKLLCWLNVLLLGLGILWHVIFLSWHLFTCIIKYKHISDCCEHENTVFIIHINAYLNHILALGHIWARSDKNHIFGHILG